MNPNQLRQSIDTIAIIMMENRSFDHLLGHLRFDAGRADIDGIASLEDRNFWNPSGNGVLCAPFRAPDEPFPQDLPHERPFVAAQLAYSKVMDDFSMTGFVGAYEQSSGTSGVAQPPPMGLLAADSLPLTGFFAQHYAVCNRWFAPIPTSTHPNRLMAVCGYTLNEDTYNGLLPDQDTMFDWLDRHGVSWRVYSAGISFFTLMKKMWPSMLGEHFRSVNQLAYDIAHESDAEWPRVLFIEPDYNDSPIHLSGHACDNHPPLPVSFGEIFLKHVYEALTSNGDRWARMLAMLTYDEHGGFFDHVAPPKVRFPPPPAAHFTQPFESMGVRVPAIVFSPFARPRGHDGLLDHTSMLQLLAERFGADGEAYSSYVDARRQAGVGSISQLLEAEARPDVPTAPDEPLAATVELSNVQPQDTQSRAAFAGAIDAFAAAHGQAAEKKFPEIAHWRAQK